MVVNVAKQCQVRQVSDATDSQIGHCMRSLARVWRKVSFAQPIGLIRSDKIAAYGGRADRIFSTSTPTTPKNVFPTDCIMELSLTINTVPLLYLLGLLKRTS
jgi:hypothetical protein